MKRVVAQLRKHGRVLRPYLGLKFVELDRSTARSLRRSAAEQHGASQHAHVPDAGLFVMRRPHRWCTPTPCTFHAVHC